MIDYNENDLREFLASLGWPEEMIEKWFEEVKARPPNPVLEKIVSIVAAVKEYVEKQLNEFYDDLYVKTGRGTLLPSECIEILLPFEIAKAWIDLERKPLNQLTLCEGYVAKGWKMVWVEERINSNDKEFVIVFQA